MEEEEVVTCKDCKWCRLKKFFKKEFKMCATDFMVVQDDETCKFAAPTVALSRGDLC